MSIAILFGTMLGTIAIGMPVGYAIGLATLVTLVTSTNIDVSLITQKAITGLDSFPLMAIPFFILAGMLMTHGGIARRLIQFFDLFVGRLTGGLGMISAVTCMFYGAISGSAMATASAIGSFMVPEMNKAGYDKGYSGALIAAAGTIGIIIPPSIPFVIYGVVTGTSIGDLFIAGVIPGVLMTLALMIVNYFVSKKYGYRGSAAKLTAKDAGKTFFTAIPALASPIIVLGGIYAGIFTPTEAAVISVVYSFVVGWFVYHELNPKNTYKALYDSMVINGVTTFMVGLSMAFAAFLSVSQIPLTITNAMLSVSDNPIIILIMINFFLLVVGCLIDNIPACIILAPILLPVVEKIGMTDIQFGVVLTLNLAIGFVTPPYGSNLFVMSAIADISIDKMFKSLVPIILSLIVVLVLVTYVPATTLFLLGK